MRSLSAIFCLLAATAFAQQPALTLSRQKTASESEKVKLYRALSRSYAETQPDSAVHYANEGMRLAEKLNDRQGQAALLLELGQTNMLHHHSELARSFYNEALGLYRRLKDAAGRAHTYDLLGVLDDNSSDFNHALKYYQDTHDSSGLIDTYAAMGQAAAEKGEHEKALNWHLRALTQYEHRKQQPEAYFVLLENIGLLYRQNGDSLTALHYLQEGLRQSRRQG